MAALNLPLAGPVIIEHPLLLGLNLLCCAVLLWHAACMASLTKRLARDPTLLACALLVGGSLGTLLGPVYGYTVPPVSELLNNAAFALIVLDRWRLRGTGKHNRRAGDKPWP